MREERKTLTRYTIESEHRHPGSTGEFSGLLNAVATAVKIISNQVRRGALASRCGRRRRGERSRRGAEQARPHQQRGDDRRDRVDRAPGRNGVSKDRRHLPRPGNRAAREVPAGIRPAGRLGRQRRQRLGGHDLLGPAQPRPGSRAAGRALPPAGHRSGVRGLRPVRAVHDVRRSPPARASTDSPSTATSARSSSPIRSCAFPRTARSSRSTLPTSASGSRRCAATSPSAWPGRTGPRGRDFNMRWIASLVAETSPHPHPRRCLPVPQGQQGTSGRQGSSG